MKINTAVAEIERGNVGDEVGFSMEFNAKMAAILSKGIYQNVIAAPIRELICNAWDSHVEANTTHVPVKIHLPNTLEPWFEVQDQGVGLSHGRMLRLYTRYGASDKTNTNLQTGGFGLGSKAPFAYGSTFSVISVFEGVRRHYVMYQNEQGMPCVSVMGEEPTTEPNGVAVRVPAKPEDFDAWRTNLQEFMVWFGGLAEVSGNSRYVKPTVEFSKKLEGQNWKLISSHMGGGVYRGTYGAIAVMGNVAYPIRVHSVKSCYHHLVQHPIAMYFRIGELEPSVSREDLQYDPATVQVLETRFTAVIKDINSQISKMVSDAPTLWQARVAIRHLVHDQAVGSLLRSLAGTGLSAKWQNTAVEFESSASWRDQFDDAKTIPKVMQIMPRTSRAEQVNSVSCRQEAIFVLKNTKDATSRAKAAYFGDNAVRHIVYVIEGVDGWDATKCQQVAKLLAYLGNPPTVISSSLSRAPQAVMKFKGRSYCGSSWRRTKESQWKPEEELSSHSGGFYVTVNGLTPEHDHLRSDLGTLLSLATDCGIVPKGTKVWGINRTNTRVIAANPVWVNIVSHVRSKIEEMVGSGQLIVRIQAEKELRTAGENLSGAPGDWLTALADHKGLFSCYVKTWAELANQTPNTVDVYKLRRLAAEVSVSLPEPSMSEPPLGTVFERVLACYPLLKHVPRHQPFDMGSWVDYVKLVDTAKN
jgi:hypothetical protein